MSDTNPPLFVNPDRKVLVELQSAHYPSPIQVNSAVVLENIKPLENHSDFTVLIKQELFINALRAADPDRYILAPGPPSMDFVAKVNIRVGNKEFKSTKPCRVHAASAFGGKFYCVTFRGVKFPGLDLAKWNPKRKSSDWAARRSMLGWSDVDPEQRKKDLNKGYFVCQSQVAEVMYDCMFSGQDLVSKGLLLITGATASGKTELMNMIVGKYLCEFVKRCKQRPHIVVLGDPVETLLFQENIGEGSSDVLNKIAEYQKKPRATRPFDYTARVLGRDSPSVAAALRDALRETPAVYVVSELRETNDFLAALDFAATAT